MPRRKYAWEKLSDEQLLKKRLGSLRVRLERHLARGLSRHPE